jgi:AcrR family transcriptional regulator
MIYTAGVSPSDGADLVSLAELLWRAESERGAAQRPRLRVGLIVETAIAIADAEGLEAVSMQRVAADLGYTPMALYRHVPGKAHLVAAMADTAYGTPPAAAKPRPGWRTEVESWVYALWQVYVRRPWLLRTPTLSAPIGPNALAWTEALLNPLARAGLDGGDLISTATFLSGAVRDLARIATALDPAEAGAYGQILAERLDPQRFPIMAALATGDTFDDDGDLTPMVRFGLRRLLDGIDNHVNGKGNG